MSLAHKLYDIGKLVSKEEIKKIIESKPEDIGSYVVLQIDFKIKNSIVVPPNKIVLSSLDKLKTMFTKKIGGTSNSYYLYPNFEYQKESDLYKKFKSTAHTFENSVLVYANEDNHKLAKQIFDYIKKYDSDSLNFKEFDKGNYFLVFTINGKSIFELMPEIVENYFDDFVDAHIYKKVKGVRTPQLKEQIDFITHKKEMCGYNPNVKFFTMDNYNDAFKPQIINKLPMSKETAVAIKKGWMYAITHLEFYHKGLKYIIIPSMVNFDDEVYQKLLKYLQRANNVQNIASKEDSFIRRLSKQIEDFNKSSISLDILFVDINRTNLSVKIFATLEDVIPSRINEVVDKMSKQKISASIKQEENSDSTYLRNYFSRDELFAIATKNTASMANKITQEKIYLAKLLLGYEQIDYLTLLKKFEHEREYDYEHKKKLENGIKNWINYPNSFASNEKKVIDFLESIDSIKNRR